MNLSSLRSSMRWMLVGQALLLAAIAVTVSLQVHRVQRKIVEMADLKDPSPFTGALMADIGQMHANLLGFMQNRDAQANAALQQADIHFRQSITDFQKENPRLFPEQAQKRILSAYEVFAGNLGALLTLGAERRKHWEELLTDQDDISGTLEFRLRPLVKASQPRAMVRVDLLSNLDKELRLIPEAMTRAFFGQPAAADESVIHGKKFERFLGLYASMAQTTAERRDLERVRASWTHLRDTANALAEIDRRCAGTLSTLRANGRNLHDTIVTVLPPVRPEVIAQKKDAALHAIHWTIALTALLILAGIGSVVVTGFVLYRRLRAGLQEIRAVAEAAATGDLSKEAESHATRDIGAMAGSVNKLIGMLRRSEQLALQLGSIVESTGDASIGLTMDGQILSWNRGAERMYGYKIDEVKSKSVEMLFASNRADDYKKMVLVLSSRKSVTQDTIHLRKSHSRIIVRLILSRILDTTGNPIGMIMVARDIAYWGRTNVGDSPAQAA